MNELEELFGEFGESLIAEIRAAMEAGNVNATGKSSGSLEWITPRAEEFQLLGDKSFTWIEQGRGPGGQPPVEVLEEWIEAKGIIPADGGTVLQMAWGLAKKIARDGTQLHAKGARRDVYTSVITPERVDAFLSLVSAKLGARVSSDIVQIFKT